MKICIIGDGLVSLSLANVLIKKELSVDILSNKKDIKYDKTRTLGISKSNIDYFNNQIINIEKILWKIKKIKIYTEKNSNQEILNFSNNDEQIFSIIKNYELKKLLKSNLRKSKLIKFKNIKHNQYIDLQKYKLVINCNTKNPIFITFLFCFKIKKNFFKFSYISVF